MYEVKATMAGNISKLLVNENDFVNEGDEVYILESMKMQIPVQAEKSGTVRNVHVNEGDFVNDGDVIISID